MTSQITEFRSNKDEFFAMSHHSPIPDRDRVGWQGLAYFDPAEELIFTLPVTPADGTTLTVQTSDGHERVFRRIGTVTFPVEGDDATLTLLASDSQHGVFVPFRDATSGKESYGAGRYLDLEPNEDGTVTLDFNYAYNPYCAYSDAYSCPLPPVENWLTVPIRAGERTYR
jgi:uncharacterized protein (DUF1684 family)